MLKRDFNCNIRDFSRKSDTMVAHGSLFFFCLSNPATINFCNRLRIRKQVRALPKNISNFYYLFFCFEEFFIIFGY